jgi:hypothetical protein
MSMFFLDIPSGMAHPLVMRRKARVYIVGAVAAFGLMVAVGRPLLKLHDEASRQATVTPIFAMGILQDARITVAPVAVGF